jgi:hypothetical protein
MTTRTYHTYNDYLAHWSENDKKAEKYIKEKCKNEVIDQFYSEFNFYAEGELPKNIMAGARYPTDKDAWIYPKHTTVVRTMCKEVEEFIQSKGFPYKLNVNESGVENLRVWPIRCKFELNK